MKALEQLWKYLYCSWAHRDYRCYPEVWGRGLDGPWHCTICHPCGEELDRLLKKLEKDERP